MIKNRVQQTLNKDSRALPVIPLLTHDPSHDWPVIIFITAKARIKSYYTPTLL